MKSFFDEQFTYSASPCGPIGPIFDLPYELFT